MDLLMFSFAFLLLIQLISALPLPESWKQRKPLSCHVCMSGWLGIIVGTVTVSLIPIASAGLTFFLLSVLDALGARSWPMPPAD